MTVVRTSSKFVLRQQQVEALSEVIRVLTERLVKLLNRRVRCPHCGVSCALGDLEE